MARPPLTQAQAAALQRAFTQLRQGGAADALAGVRAVLAAAPDAPEAMHLEALCLRDLGDREAAAAAFARANEAAPSDADILNNFGAFLRRAGEPGQAIAKLKAALALAPGRADAWINLSAAQLDLRDFRAAKASAERAAASAPNAAGPLRALAAAARELGDLPAAETALRRAVALEPSGATWTALGVVRRLAGDPAEALECYANAHALGFDAPELLDAEASAHLDLGDTARALADARALTERAPSYAPGHVMLAHLMWEHGAGVENDPLAPLARAVAAQPGHAALRTALAQALVDAERPQEALEHLRVLRAAADAPALAVLHASALDMLGDHAGAGAVFAETLQRGAAYGLGTAYALHLMRVGRADEAARYALRDAEANPEDQRPWCALSVAWRLIGDPREHWLCDYERFVCAGFIEPPPGYADRESFVHALSETLTAMHQAQNAPINQTLRGGSQTPGVLFGRRGPVIAAARDALHACVRRLIAELPRDGAHPFLRRNTGDIRFTGSWSVRLRSAGKHVNHFHPEGWLSSAFYVQLPPSVSETDPSHAGWIQFGQPPADSGVVLEPRRAVRPDVGKLVLFPSFMLHGTIPFADPAPRMTIAFDAKPI